MVAKTDDKDKQQELFEVQQVALGRYQKTADARAFRDDLAWQLFKGERAQLEDLREQAKTGEIVVSRGKDQPAARFKYQPRTTPLLPAHGTPQGLTKFKERQKRLAADGPRPELARTEDGSGEAALLPPAKSQSRSRQVIDEKTGEIQGFSYNERRNEFEADFDPVTARLEAFALQAAAREILKGITKPAKTEGGKPRPQYRVCDCLRNSLSGAEGVSIVKSARVDSVRFSGLQTCGSVWHCKVCGTRISEVRKLEVRHAVDTWLAAGHGVLFVTNTFPHARADDLREMLAKLLDVAWNRYINHRSYKRVRKLLGYLGRIRALEVTWSEQNGWHPHVHEIWFIEKPLSDKEMKAVKSELFKVWKVTAKGAGFKAPSYKHGLDVQGAESAADYIAKFGTEPRWEIAKEMAKSHIKKSRDRKGRTPFDLVREYAETGASYAADLFREYAVAFAGKTQLYWSQGLKGEFKIDEISDEQIAAHQEDDAIVLAQLTFEEWRLVLRSRDRGLVLELARNGGAEAVALYIGSLRARYDERPAVAVVEDCPF